MDLSSFRLGNVMESGKKGRKREKEKNVANPKKEAR